jgi:hypothetical protein
MVSDSQLVVEVGHVLANLRSSNLLLHLDCLEHEFFCPAILLFLSQLNRHSLHSSCLLLIDLGRSPAKTTCAFSGLPVHDEAGPF